MKKYFLALCLTVCLSCVACGSEQKVAKNYTRDELLEKAEENKELLERGKALKEVINESLSTTSSEWLISTEDPITVSAQKEDVRVTVRVVTSQIIPRVADDICHPLIDAITDMGYEKYKISINHTSNLKNEEASGALWETEDGVTGLFADNESEKVIFQSGVSIDDLYSYYDNFGLEDAEAEKKAEEEHLAKEAEEAEKKAEEDRLAKEAEKEQAAREAEEQKLLAEQSEKTVSPDVNPSNDSTQGSPTAPEEAANAETPPEPEPDTSTPVGGTVWLSATGEKYHRINNCGKMNPNKARQVSLEEALRKNYEKCNDCW